MATILKAGGPIKVKRPTRRSLLKIPLDPNINWDQLADWLRRRGKLRIEAGNGYRLSDRKNFRYQLGKRGLDNSILHIEGDRPKLGPAYVYEIHYGPDVFVEAL